MWYEHQEYKLELLYGKAKFYDKGQLMFKGDGYTGLQMFIRASNNNPEVMEKFKSQLRMREKPRFENLPKSDDEE